MIYAFIAGGILLTGLIAFAPRVIWLPAVAVALIAVAVPLFRLLGERRKSSPVEPSTLYVSPPLPVEPHEERVEQVPLPSQEKDYDFLFSSRILWSPLQQSWDNTLVNPVALAVDAILKRARMVTERCEPGRASLVAHELGAALGTMRDDPTGYVQAMAESVQITLSTQDQERLNKLAAVRKDRVIWEHDRKYEQSKREYLSEDVLKDTGSAVVWWLVRNDDHVEKTVHDIDLLARLSSVVNNREIPEPAAFGNLSFGEYGVPQSTDGASSADCLAAFLRTLDLRGQSDLFTHQIVLLLRKYGQPDPAEEISHRFDLPGPAPAYDDVPQDATVDCPDAVQDDQDVYQQNGRSEQI
ncbi:hypothetical protein [Streptosporangium subroseum]|uniref:hypothetical protein n=1 Tax=Streptosporangium subroseum TaxID=106412 RepID=UPI0030906327|nr:hypothetical protein OHB15_31525 [Streptosporangium subroseum]